MKTRAKTTLTKEKANLSLKEVKGFKIKKTSMKKNVCADLNEAAVSGKKEKGKQSTAIGTQAAKVSGKMKTRTKTELIKEKLICDYCGELFGRKSRLVTHFNKVHSFGIQKIYECGICGTKYTYKSNLTVHLKKKHESDGGNNSPIGIPSTVESLAHKEPDNVLDKVLLAIQTDSMGIFHHSYILHDIAQNAELIDHNVLKELEESGLINTWSGGQLFPLKTTTKRSLTNAITMALWGRKDGNNSIGIALQQFLEKNREKFQSFPILPNDNKQTDVGHTSSLKPLKRVKLLKRHLVALSNLIRRPIVVFSKEELHGIYPPLFHEFLECMRCPLFLGYSNKRFSALVAKTRTGKVPLFLVPIHGDVDSRFKEITRQYIRYMNHNGIDVELEKLKDCFRVDINILMALETAQSINWWKSVPNCAYLRPLITSGNGNCLLNAIALALYGNEDFSLILRRALNEFILTPIYSEPLQRRWRVAQTQLNERDQFCLTDEQWLVEWQKILNSSSTSPKNEPKGAEKSTYEFLESIHIFALANLIRRPIIVFASYEIASRDIIGLYLPILFPPNDSYHTPLFLGFDSSHFVLLIPHSTPTIVPISNTNGFILPVLFLQDHSSQQCRDITPIVNEYLTIKLIRHDDKLMVCAAIDHKYASEKLITFM